MTAGFRGRTTPKSRNLTISGLPKSYKGRSLVGPCQSRSMTSTGIGGCKASRQWRGHFLRSAAKGCLRDHATMEAENQLCIHPTFSIESASFSSSLSMRVVHCRWRGQDPTALGGWQGPYWRSEVFAGARGGPQLHGKQLAHLCLRLRLPVLQALWHLDRPHWYRACWSTGHIIWLHCQRIHQSMFSCSFEGWRYGRWEAPYRECSGRHVKDIRNCWFQASPSIALCFWLLPCRTVRDRRLCTTQLCANMKRWQHCCSAAERIPPCPMLTAPHHSIWSLLRGAQHGRYRHPHEQGWFDCEQIL